MKKIIKLGLAALSCASIIGLASCDKTNPLDNVPDYSEFEEIDMETIEVGLKTLSSISIDSTNGKLNYYVGDKFTTDGLVVKANYVQLVNGSPQGSSQVIDSYFYDDSDVDMNKAGTYTVVFKYREGAIVKETNLTINVTHSYLADLGIEYLAGLEPKETVIEIAKNSTFNAKNDVKFVKKYMTGTEETKSEEMTSQDIEALVVETTIDTTKTGKYTVYYNYAAKVTLADNSEYNYKLRTFVVIIVK